MEFGTMRHFTKEEQKKYTESTGKLYKPTGVNIMAEEKARVNESKGCKFGDNLVVSCADCVNREETLKAAKQLIKEMYDSWANGVNDSYLGPGEQIFRKARKFLEVN